MKNPVKLLLSIGVILLVVVAQSCASSSFNDQPLKKFCKKHKDVTGFTSFSLPPGLLRLFVEKEEKELRQILRDLDDIRIIIYSEEEGNSGSCSGFLSELGQSLSEASFHELMVIRDGKDVITFQAREQKEKIRELMMIVEGETEFVVLHFTGDIDLDKIGDLSGSIDVQGVKHLDKLDAGKE